MRDVPVAVSEAPDVFLVTLAPLGIGVLEPDGVRFLEEAPLPGLISPVGVRGRELGDVPLTGIVSLRVGVVVPDPLPAVRLPGVTRR